MGVVGDIESETEALLVANEIDYDRTGQFPEAVRLLNL